MSKASGYFRADAGVVNLSDSQAALKAPHGLRAGLPAMEPEASELVSEPQRKVDPVVNPNQLTRGPRIMKMLSG